VLSCKHMGNSGDKKCDFQNNLNTKGLIRSGHKQDLGRDRKITSGSDVKCKQKYPNLCI
jgi:hypothetical protein